jgi:hypothetical protein
MKRLQWQPRDSTAQTTAQVLFLDRRAASKTGSSKVNVLQLSSREVILDKVFLIEWLELLIPTHSLAEIVLRGTVMYLSLFLILRFVMLRQSSTIGIADILVIVVIADAAQNGFAKKYRSITEGVLLVLTTCFGTSA